MDPVEETTQAATTESAPEETTQAATAESAPAEATSETPDTGSEPAKEPEKEPKAVRELKEQRRKRQELEKENEVLRRILIDKEKPKDTPPEKPPVSGRPRLDQFETTEEYEDALLAWHETKKEVETSTARKQRELDDAWASYNERADTLRAEREDFDEVTSQPIYGPATKIALMKSENGPEVAYWLGTHPKEAEKLLRMPQYEALVELGRIETKLILAKSTKKAPEAPPPIKPVGMGGGGKAKDPSEMSDDEWFAWKKEQEKKSIEERLRARGRI